MKRINIFITEEQFDRLNRIAKKEGSSYTEVIRQFIAENLSEKERKVGLEPFGKEEKA
jgi:metal-responsive CopG/Arc/MetJ family transcriptional regulator